MRTFRSQATAAGLATLVWAVAAAVPTTPAAVAATPGIYVGEAGGRKLTLEVSRNGRFMSGWSGQLRLRCGGYPGIFTYPTVALDFPKTKIAESGWLRRTWRGDGFTMKMQARFAGRGVREGSVTYSGAGRCVGSADWTAQLKGSR